MLFSSSDRSFVQLCASNNKLSAGGLKSESRPPFPFQIFDDLLTAEANKVSYNLLRLFFWIVVGTCPRIVLLDLVPLGEDPVTRNGRSDDSVAMNLRRS